RLPSLSLRVLLHARDVLGDAGRRLEPAYGLETRLPPHRPDRRQRMNALLRVQQVAAREHRQPALRPVFLGERSELPELLERQRMAVAPRGADLEAQQLEPVPEPAFADHPLLANRIAARRQEMAEPPRPGRREAQHDDLAV